MEEQQQEATCRAMWTGENPVDVVDGVPFVNLGDEKGHKCVSAPVSEERMARWRRFGYVDFDGDTAEVDRLLADRRMRDLEAEDQRQFTIESLQDSNRRLSEDLVAARRKIEQILAANPNADGSQVADLQGQLATASRRIAELEAGAGAGDGSHVSDLQKSLDAATAQVAELTAARDLMIEECRRIAALPHGLKKELESMLESVEGQRSGDAGQ